MHGVLNVLKPPGMTSHDAVAFVRRVLQIKRVGHTGTLDPAAAGVLPICVGQATRLVEYLQSGTKEYIAEATFGSETDTGDVVGQIVAEGDARGVNLESLRAALDPFRGAITQTPPLHSAIKIGGKKLYELAREGKTDVEIPTRDVFIDQLRVTRLWNDLPHPRAMLHIECTGGTYIRSLVRDVGRTLGCHATMTFLVRTRNGAFPIKEAQTLEEIAEKTKGAMIPITEVLEWCAQLSWQNDEAAQALSKGQTYQSPIAWRNLGKEPHHITEESKKITRKAGWLDTIGSQRALFWSDDKAIAVLASRVKPLSLQQYQPDKVFFLNSTNDA